ncbi:MAG: hypothetical protein ACRD0K_25870 [Egibacteraceae bacterium]
MTRTVGIALAILVGMFAAACQPSSFQYVANSDDGAYLILPSDWHRFESDEVLEYQFSDLAPRVQEVLREQMWVAAFDANPQPALEHVFNFGDLKEYPVGFMQVRQLAGEERYQLSLSDLRNQFIEFDTIAQSAPERLEVLREDYPTTPEGLRGVNLRFSVAVEEGLVTYDQTAYVDADTSTVYLLTVGCTADCFEAHSSQIDRIIQSWTIKEPNS